MGVSGSIEIYDGPRPGRCPYNFMDSYPVAVDRQNQQLGLSREHVRTSAAREHVRTSAACGLVLVYCTLEL